MRVLHLSSLWPPAVLGGAELYAARLAERQAFRGDAIGVVTLGAAGDYVVAEVPAWPYRLDRFHVQPVWRRALFHSRDLYDPVASRAVRRVIESFSPDIVHSHAVTGMSASVLAAPSVAGRPHVHTLHDHWLLCERTTLVAADGTACDPERRCRGCRAFARAREVELRRHFADVVVAPSQSVAATHVHAWPWLSARMEVVRHPVDAPTAAIPAAREPRGPVVFGYLGHLSPAKGVRTLLAAMLGLPAGVARLVVAGRGELEAEVAAADVEWLGWVDAERREQFFATIDCLVVPSQAPETAGLVVDEARARGLAVIAADTGALPEYVDPACRPLLYPPGDVASLTDRLASFVAAPDAYRPTGPMPSSWAEHLDALDAVYERARRVAMRRP